MNLRLRTLDRLEEALELLPLLDQAAEEGGKDWRDREVEPGIARAFLERSFDRRETIVIGAEDVESQQTLAAIASGPFEDPLTFETTPMIVLLYVRPEIRHRGVARALILELSRRLTQRGFDALLARAGHNDDALISMAERLGMIRTFEVMSSE